MLKGMLKTDFSTVEACLLYVTVVKQFRVFGLNPVLYVECPDGLGE